MPSVAIVGAGLIGRAWAIVFSRAGWDVRMTDPHQPTLAAAPGLVRAGLDELAKHGLVTDPAGAAARVSAAPSLAEAVSGVALVQENGPERVDAPIQRALIEQCNVLEAAVGRHVDDIAVESDDHSLILRLRDQHPRERLAKP